MRNTEKKETKKVVQKAEKLTPQQVKIRNLFKKAQDMGQKLYLEGKIEKFDRSKIYSNVSE